MCLVRRDTENYAISTHASGIAAIANKVKTVPDAYINEAGNGVTEACLAYLRPLVLGERRQSYENGIPKHFVLK